jgi:hypothetical protein
MYLQPLLKFLLSTPVGWTYMVAVFFIFRWCWLTVRKLALHRKIVIGLYIVFVAGGWIFYRMDFLRSLDCAWWTIFWMLGMPILIWLYCGFVKESQNNKNQQHK